MNVPHNKPTLGEREILAASRVLQSGWVAQGREVAALEDEFCNFLGLPQGHVVAVSSGTAALYLAMLALNVSSQKVALPVYACSALRNAASMAGAEIVYCDNGQDSPNVDIEKVNNSSVSCAVIPHMFGIPAPISNVNDSIKVIEDCAQSLGALVDGVPAGTVGELGVFSFYATKVITAGGQGGMVVSKNKDYIEFIKDYRNFDCRRDTKTRFNFQLTDLQAAVARTQLSQLPQFLRRRAEIFQAYTDAKLNLLGIGATGAVRYRAVFKTAIPQQLIQALAKDSIGAIVPIEKYELLSDAPDFRNAIILCNSTVSLPIYPLLEETSVQKIVERCCAL